MASSTPARLRGCAASVVCVIGDTAADHALAVLCDRLFHRAGWIPLSKSWQDQNLASAARLGIYELGHVTGSPSRPVLMTSISESQDALRSLISELRSYGLGVPGDPRGRFDVIPPGDLASEPARSLLADPRHFSVRRRVPVRREADASSLLMPLDLPIPEAAGHLPADMQWMGSTRCCPVITCQGAAKDARRKARLRRSHWAGYRMPLSARGATVSRSPPRTWDSCPPAARQRAGWHSRCCGSRQPSRSSPNWPLPAPRRSYVLMPGGGQPTPPICGDPSTP